MRETIIREIEDQGEVTIVGNGVSMRPMLVPGNNLLRIRKPNRPIRKYDVVLFRKDGRYILHRVVRVRDGLYDLLGDSSLLAERGVPQKDILGILEAFVHNTKKVKNGRVKWVSTRQPLYWAYSRLVVFLTPLRRAYLRARNKSGGEGRKDV